MSNEKLISAALKATAPNLYTEIDGGDSWEASIKKRGARVDKYRKYERGDHDAKLTDQMRRLLRVDSGDETGLEEFNANYCKQIVDKMASRLAIIDVSAGDEAEEWISEVKEYVNWTSIEGEIFRSAIRDGDGFVLVDSLTLKWSTEPAYDGFTGMEVIFDNLSREIIWACKLWSEGAIEDATESEAIIKVVVYQPDKVSYWQGENDGDGIASAIDDNGENEKVWPLKRVPIVAVGNEKDNYSYHGESAERPAIPLNNLLNRTLHSMCMASEFSAFKVFYSIGIELDNDGITPGATLNLIITDEDGNASLDVTPEQIEFLKAVRVGEFGESDMSNYTIQLDQIVVIMSNITQTPLYGVTGKGVLSGDALRQLEVGLIGKVERFQRENDKAIRGLFKLTADMQTAFTTQAELSPPPDLTTISLNWKSPEIIDVEKQVTVLVTMREKAPGLWDDDWYRKRVGGLLGMTQAQIKLDGEKAQNAQSMMFDNIIDGGDMGTGEEASVMERLPENIESEQGLNGAQIKAAIDVIKSMNEGSITADVATELLIAVGIGAEKVEKMIASQASIKPDASIFGGEQII